MNSPPVRRLASEPDPCGVTESGDQPVARR